MAAEKLQMTGHIAIVEVLEKFESEILSQWVSEQIAATTAALETGLSIVDQTKIVTAASELAVSVSKCSLRIRFLASFKGSTVPKSGERALVWRSAGSCLSVMAAASGPNRGLAKGLDSVSRFQPPGRWRKRSEACV